MPMRTRIGPGASPSSASAAASSALGAVGKATKKASPCVSTSTPPWAPKDSRRMRRCSPSPCAYSSAPSSYKSLDEPSTSVKRKVTVPEGRSRRTGVNHARERGLRHWGTSDKEASQAATLAYDAGAADRAQVRKCVVGQFPLLVGEVVDEICAGLVVLAYVVVVDCLFDQPAGGNEIVDGRGGGVSLLKKRFAVDLAQHSAVALDARVRPD